MVKEDIQMKGKTEEAKRSTEVSCCSLDCQEESRKI